jgi:hypothetical protein
VHKLHHALCFITPQALLPPLLPGKPPSCTHPCDSIQAANDLAAVCEPSALDNNDVLPKVKDPGAIPAQVCK